MFYKIGGGIRFKWLLKESTLLLIRKIETDTGGIIFAVREDKKMLSLNGQCFLCEVLVAHLFPTLCDPMDCSPQAPLFMEVSRQEYWSGLLFPSSGYLPNPGIKSWSLALQADSLTSELPGKSIFSVR